MIGSGNIKAGQAVDVAGTCSMFCVSTNGIIPELSKKGAGLIFNSGTLPNLYFYWGYIRTGGLALRWFKDNICGHEGDGFYYDILNDGLAQVTPGSNGVFFLPYLTGGTNDIKNATGCFLNMTMDTDQATMWHAVLEAIGYDYMEITVSIAVPVLILTVLLLPKGAAVVTFGTRSRRTCWAVIL